MPPDTTLAANTHRRHSLHLSGAYFANGRKALGAIPNRLNLLYTILIFFNNFAFGISVNLFGATLVDLSQVYNVSLSVLSHVIIANSVGYMLGAIVPYAYKWANRQLVVTVASGLLALTSLLVPHYHYLIALFIAWTLNGLGSGVWDASHTAWLVDMWPEGNAPLLQANQFLFGVGATASPLLASRFIFGEANFTNIPEVNQTLLTRELRQMYLSIPFVINGITQMIAPILLLILFFTHRYKYLPSMAGPRPSKDHLHLESGLSHIPTPKKARRIQFRRTKLALCGLAIAASFTAEFGYFPYCTALYQYLEIRLSASESAHVTSILSLFYTLGPLLTAFISLKIRSEVILLYHYGFILGGTAILYWGRFNLSIIYVGNAVLGYGFSAMIPAQYAFTQAQYGLDDRVCSYFSFLSGSISLVIPLILASTFADNPLLLLHLLAAFVSLSLLIFLGLKVWIFLESRKGRFVCSFI